MNRTWIELDRDALAYNIRQYQSHLPAGCGIMGVVKADAYGHGAHVVARELYRLGVRRFAVAALAEAVELRRGGLEGEILILGYTHPDGFPQLVQYDITQTAACAGHAARLEAFGRESGTPVKVHIAVDSGMHRIGFLPGELDQMEAFCRSPWLRVTGIFSHLCVADVEAEDGFTRRQAQVFQAVLDELRARGAEMGEVHLLNSYGAVNYPEYAYDFARLGILMYGVLSDGDGWLRTDLKLRPVMTLKSRITSLRHIGPGETVSYGRTYRAEKPVTIASVAIGYADGIPRTLSGGKIRAIVRGRYVQGVGRVCMDQLMLDVTGVEGVQLGDEAIFIGQQGDCRIPAEELAKNAGTITNDLLSGLSARVEGRFFTQAEA